MSSKLLSSSLDVNSGSSFFLDPFAVGDRSLVANQFFTAVRSGSATVDEVILSVKGDAHRRMITSAGEQWTTQHRLLSILDSEEARLYAKEILDREALPPEEKHRLKTARQEHHRREYLRAQSPTERQIRYLKSLGYQSTPANRLQASELIEEELHKQ